MNTVIQSIRACACALGVVIFPALQSVGVTLPYIDSFDSPPYVNNTSVVGQNGWQNYGGGTPAMAVITNDFTTTTSPIHPAANGFGTSLFIGNAAGSYADVKQVFVGITNDDWKVTFDLYGTLPSSTFATPLVEFLDATSGTEVAAIEALQLAGAGTNAFRLNVNNARIVPNVAAQGHTWYAITFDFHLPSRTYDAQVTDGVVTGALYAVPFWTPQAMHVDFIRILPEDAGSFPNESGLIDNLSVVPEPSVLALALTALLGVASRRWFAKN